MRATSQHVAATIAAVLTLPCLAQACPVCFSAANENVLRAYYTTAAVMTVVPLLMLGSIGGWLYVRATRARPSACPPLREGDAPGEKRT